MSYELLLSMLRYGFEEIKLEKVTATIYEDNKYSRNTVEKLGFKSDSVSKVLNALATELPPEKHTSEELLRAGLMRLQF